jgi:hypothetical protein
MIMEVYFGQDINIMNGLMYLTIKCLEIKILQNWHMYFSNTYYTDGHL